ncbi:MAG: nitroreductase family protein [Clostridium sp.]|uniref:nitroreductase family protein n=1 Tax=Clostridium sp. TaxID=1506 RepID=UPI003F2E4A6B
MNEVIKAIKNRRSTRVFTEEVVNEDIIKEIIDAGLSAPSGHNMQPWHFTVITNKDILDMLSTETKNMNKEHSDDFIKKVSNNEKYHVFYNAPVGIIVSGKEDSMTVQSDVAAASENILLAAESLGLGGCWIGFITLLFMSDRGEEFKKKLNIPEGFKPMHGLVLGHKKVQNTKETEKREGTVSFIK